MTEPLHPLPDHEPAAERPPTKMGVETPAPVVDQRPQIEEPVHADELYRQGLEVQALTQFQLMRRRFFRHKLAVGALTIFLVICALAFFAGTFGIYPATGSAAQDPLVGPAHPEYPATVRPSYAHPFGRDAIGRDVYARVLEGTRQSLRVGLGTALIAGFVGTLLGGLAGYYRGWVDNLLMRVTDLVFTVPALAVLLVLSQFGENIPLIGPLIAKKDATAVMLILGVLLWTQMARVVRGVFLSLREKEYVESARALGASDSRIMAKHLLPNAVGPIIVESTLIVATAILIETALSFLGFGIQPPATSLGRQVADAQNSLTVTPWEIWFPGLMIVGICLCINFIGDGLRDALDPTGKKVRA